MARGLASLLAAFVVPVVLAAGCSEREEAAAAKPAIGAVPQRIVSLAPSCTETVVALGVAPRLVAISDFCPALPEGCAAQRIGGLVNLNVEALLALRPDLVLTVQDADDRALANVRRRGIAVRAVDPQSLDALVAEVRSLGALLGVAARGDELADSLAARLAAVREKVAKRATRPRVYVEVDFPQWWTIGRKTFVHEALTAAGGDNVFGDVERAYFPTNAEEIVVRAPDVVLLLHPVEGPLDGRRELAALAAKGKGRVIADLVRDDLLHSSPRLVDGIERLAARLEQP
jgi:iron complex transport system substrate-binding protein